VISKSYCRNQHLETTD